MQNWHKERNYKKLVSEDGQKEIYTIYVEDGDVEVPKAIFDTYSKMDRQERYAKEYESVLRWRSLDSLIEDGTPVETIGKTAAESAEDILIRAETEADAKNERTRQIKILKKALMSLDDDEKDLIRKLFYEKTSARQYAKELGISLSTLQYRRDRLFAKLRKFFSENQ